MRMNSNSRGLAVVLATLGLAAVAPFAGCSGDEPSSVPVTSSSGTGGSGGEGGEGGSGGGMLKCNLDGTLVEPEQCDDGNMVGGDGCETDCTFTCNKDIPVLGDPKCDDTDPCNGKETCSDKHTCDPGTLAADGTACGTGKVCKTGVCVDETCGDAFVSGNEECDDGNLVDGDGCNACQFSCVKSDPLRDCSTGDPCQGTSCDEGTHTCANPIPEGQSCGASAVCKGGVCTPAMCGDGVVDPAAGEECEPPNTPTCSATCKKVAAVTCGNGTREAGEECDDSNQTNLDGCDAFCKFEQDHRANYLKMQFVTDAAFCPANALGVAISGPGQSQIQTSLDEGITDGSIAIMFKILGLDDLSGTSDPQIELGLVDGGPVVPMGATYDGNNAPDWWYTAEAISLDPNRNPLAKLPGSINAKTLTAGPGTVTLNLLLGGSPAPLKLSDTRVTGLIGATNTPAVSMGATPGHLAAENLDPALVSFATMGQKTTNGAGKLCGNVSAFSLSKVPIPDALTAGITACSQGYTATNTMLDVFVNGCTVFFTQVIKPTQPDKIDAGAPVAGAGGPYKLSVNAQKTVGECRDSKNAVVDLNTCLNAAAYSSFFKIATERVILK